MKCAECPFTEKVQRKYGITTHCTKDITHMDVTFHVNNNTECLICPLRDKKRRHIKDSTGLSGGHLW